MIINDSTVIIRLPIIVTAQSGMLSKNPHSSITLIIVSGSNIFSALVIPDVFIIMFTTPCKISNIAVISSSPYVTMPFAIAKRINSFSTYSGLFVSEKVALSFTTPAKKTAQAVQFLSPLMHRVYSKSHSKYHLP